MRERERRSLHKVISTSRKVNALSLKAALLYTWSISHEDDEGYQEGDPRTLKHTVIPFRDDIPIEDIKPLILEICTIHQKVNDSTPLWNLFHIHNKVFIQNPVSNQKQTYHGVHKIPSEIKKLIADTPKTDLYINDNGAAMVQPGAQRVHKLSEVKLSEVKGSEVKGSTTTTPFPFEKENPNQETPTPIKRTLDEEVERIKRIEKEKGHYMGINPKLRE